MNYGSFLELYGSIGSLEEKTQLLLDFAEEEMQTYPDSLAPLVEISRNSCMAEGLRGEAARCDWILGWMANDKADYPGALDRFERARDIFLRTADKPGLLKALNGIASSQMFLGNLETSLKVFREALVLAEDLGDFPQTLVLKANIGEALVELRQYSEAEHHLREALAPGVFRPLNESLVLNQWAKACLGLGMEPKAMEALDRSISLSREGRFLSSLAFALDLLGSIEMSSGFSDLAQPRLVEARTVARQSGDRSVEARATLNLGRLREISGDRSGALDHFTEALETSRAIGSQAIEAEALDHLYRIHRSMENWKQALETHEAFHQVDQKLHSDRVSRQVAQIRSDQVERETNLLRDQTRTLALLGDIGRRITASLNLETIMVTVYEAIGGLMKAQFFGLGLYIEETNSIDYRLVIEEGVRVTPSVTPADDDSFSGWCIRNRQDLLVSDSDKEYPRYMATPPPRLGKGEKHSHSCLYTPLLAEGRVLGVLTAQCYETNVYSDRDLETLKTLGTSIAVAVRNSDLYEKVRQIATVDSLTGAATRRHLFDRAEEEFRNFLRSKVPLALVMIDLDHFKHLNDTWGHTTGDTVLQAFGALCLGRKRSHDLFGRYGGEEFALVLAGSDLPGAVKTAERLCQAVREMKLNAEDGTPVRITASFGVTSFFPDDDGVTRVFTRADEALYEAKHSGRDRVAFRP